MERPFLFKVKAGHTNCQFKRQFKSLFFLSLVGMYMYVYAILCNTYCKTFRCFSFAGSLRNEQGYLGRTLVNAWCVVFGLWKAVANLTFPKDYSDGWWWYCDHKCGTTETENFKLPSWDERGWSVNPMGYYRTTPLERDIPPAVPWE